MSLRRSAVIVAGLAWLGTISACADGATTVSSSSTALGGDRLLVEHPRWRLLKAFDLRSDDPFATLDPSGVDWYAEYHRSTVTGSYPLTGGGTGTTMQVDQVRVTRHLTAPDATRSILDGLGYRFVDVSLPSGRVAVGRAGDDDPSVLLIDRDGASFSLLSYELTTDELVALAGSLRWVDTAAWTQAGGVICQESPCRR